MPTKGYTALGWVTWQVVTRVAKRKMGQNKAKLGIAAGALGLALVGVAAAKLTSGSDES